MGRDITVNSAVIKSNILKYLLERVIIRLRYNKYNLKGNCNKDDQTGLSPTQELVVLNVMSSTLLTQPKSKHKQCPPPLRPSHLTETSLTLSVNKAIYSTDNISLFRI